MKLLDLFENANYGSERSKESFDRLAAGAPKHAAFTFGRMNPPTLGHKALFEKTRDSAINGEYYIFVSKSHDTTDNPIPYEDKLAFIDEMFPEFAQHIIRNTEIRTPLAATNWLYGKGIRAFTMVVGADRLKEFKTMLDRWNSPESCKKDGRQRCYINLVSSGDREEGAEGLTGISASTAREAVAEGNIKSFMKTTGTTGDLAKRLYNAVRRGMVLSTLK
jgi:hypothetical protein